MRKQPPGCSLKAVDGFAEASCCFSEFGRIARLNRLHGASQFVDIHIDGLATFHGHLARNEIDCLDSVCPFVDRGDARITVVLRRTGFLDIAHSAVHLYAEGCDFRTDVGRKCLGNRRQQRGTLVCALAFGVGFRTH